MTDAELIAREFHDTYERLAPQFGYDTRTDTKQFDPDSPNGKLMIAVCGELAARLAQPTPESVVELADETIDALVERLNMSVKTPIPKPKCECKACRKVSEYRKAREVQK